jgi:segregation and condensation protein B
MRTLAARGLIAEVARDPGPGQAALYGTTTLFLEKLGLYNLDDLPPLADFVPGAEIMDSLERSLLAGPGPQVNRAEQIDLRGSGEIQTGVVEPDL